MQIPDNHPELNRLQVEFDNVTSKLEAVLKAVSLATLFYQRKVGELIENLGYKSDNQDVLAVAANFTSAHEAHLKDLSGYFPEAIQNDLITANCVVHNAKQYPRAVLLVKVNYLLSVTGNDKYRVFFTAVHTNAPVYNPFLDEYGSKQVDPLDYYGEQFSLSPFGGQANV